MSHRTAAPRRFPRLARSLQAGVHLAFVLLAFGCAEADPAQMTAPGDDANTTPTTTTTTETPPTTPAVNCTDPYRTDFNGPPGEHSWLRAFGAMQPRRYPTATIDPATDKPAERTKAFTIDGAPILYFRNRAPVLDARFISELSVVDVTRMKPGENAPVGSLMPAARGKLTPVALAKFLIESNALVVFQHAFASLCVSEETIGNGQARVRFTGVHVYYTNQETRERIDFHVDLDASGGLSVTRR